MADSCPAVAFPCKGQRPRFAPSARAGPPQDAGTAGTTTKAPSILVEESRNAARNTYSITLERNSLGHAVLS
eukprot:9500070-Alexandrium_andersonii.AAC.1